MHSRMGSLAIVSTVDSLITHSLPSAVRLAWLKSIPSGIELLDAPFLCLLCRGARVGNGVGAPGALNVSKLWSKEDLVLSSIVVRKSRPIGAAAKKSLFDGKLLPKIALCSWWPSWSARDTDKMMLSKAKVKRTYKRDVLFHLGV